MRDYETKYPKKMRWGFWIWLTKSAKGDGKATCPSCGSALLDDTLHHPVKPESMPVKRCPDCGWWKVVGPIKKGE